MTILSKQTHTRLHIDQCLAPMALTELLNEKFPDSSVPRSDTLCMTASSNSSHPVSLEVLRARCPIRRGPSPEEIHCAKLLTFKTETTSRIFIRELKMKRRK
jgi:hypothetical protein